MPLADAGMVGIRATMDLNLLQNFLMICTWHSFTGAARALGLPKSSVSRQLQALEDELGVRLLHRTTRKLTPTEAGSELLSRAAPALAMLTNATREIRDQDREPVGTVRFSAPQDLGTSPLPDILAAFLEKYPRISVYGDFSARNVDLVGEGFDCAIRFGPLQDSTLVARRIGTLKAVLVASPGYLTKHGTPRTIDELAEHNCLLFRSEGDSTLWKLGNRAGTAAIAVRGSVRANDMSFLREMTLRGLGIALMPAEVVDIYVRTARLVRVLPDYSLVAGEAHILTPTGVFVPHRVRLFVDFVAERLREYGFGREPESPAVVSPKPAATRALKDTPVATTSAPAKPSVKRGGGARTLV